MGFVAFILLAGSLGVLSQTASASGGGHAINCTGLNGSMDFGPNLSYAGLPTSSKKGGSVAISGGTFTCGVAPMEVSASDSSVLTSGGRNAKLSMGDPRYSRTTKYLTASQSEVLNGYWVIPKKTTIKFTIGGYPGLFSVKSVVAGSVGACPGEFGLILGGKYTGYYADRKASVTLCLGDDVGPGTTNNFKVDLSNPNPSVQIGTAQIDPGHSGATL